MSEYTLEIRVHSFLQLDKLLINLILTFDEFPLLGQRRSFREHLSDLPMLTRRMIQYFSTYDGIAFFMNARIVPYVLMTIVYALIPFDMVPGKWD